MPAMANITVKKADGTTDIVYTALQGAAGDGTQAIWRNDTVGTTLAERPVFSVSGQWNGPRTARRIRGAFKWPMVKEDSGGNKIIDGGAVGDFSFVGPQNQDASVLQEQAYQFGNLIASAIIKASMAEGNPPRG